MKAENNKPDISTLVRSGHFYFGWTFLKKLVLYQNDNVRFDQSRNVLLRMITLLPFRKGEQGGKRGPTDDETA